MNKTVNACFKHQLGRIGIILCLVGLYGCNLAKDPGKSVDLHKATAGKVSIRDIYESIELVPLAQVPEELTQEASLSGLCVTRDRFILQDRDRAVLFYRHDGSLADILNPGVPVTDFSIWQERVLDLLSGYEIREYALPDLSLLRRTPLDTLVVPTRIARREKNVMILPAYAGNRDYMCEYYFDRKYYAASEGNMDSGQTQDIVKHMSLFRYGDQLLALYPHNGQIWRCADFFGVFLWLDFKKRDGDSVEFLSAQVTDEKVYFALLINGAEHLLIYNRADYRYSLIKTTSESVSLPLGVIRDGVNYVCCATADLPRYLKRELLDPEDARVFDKVSSSGQYVVIKYRFL